MHKSMRPSQVKRSGSTYARFVTLEAAVSDSASEHKLHGDKGHRFAPDGAPVQQSPSRIQRQTMPCRRKTLKIHTAARKTLPHGNLHSPMKSKRGKRRKSKLSKDKPPQKATPLNKDIGRPCSAPFKRDGSRRSSLLPMSVRCEDGAESVRPKSSHLPKRGYLQKPMVQEDGYCSRCEKYGRTKPVSKHLANWKAKRFIAGQRMREPETMNKYMHDATVTVHREASLDALLHKFHVRKV